MKRLLAALAFCALLTPTVHAQHSVAREWNEVLLDHIRGDFARPTVHARNLFHTSIAMYDIWSVFDQTSRPYMLGGDECPFGGMPVPTSPEALKEVREEAISYATYRLLLHRFSNSPGREETKPLADGLMDSLGLDTTFVDTDYSTGNAAALGNYMAECLMQFGLQDGANEIAGYEPRFYEAVNPPLQPDRPGTPELVDPNRWQPLTLEVFIDQGNNTIDDNTPAFLSPEWGYVRSFALEQKDLDIFVRDGDAYPVFHDPGMPPLLEDDLVAPDYNLYQWGFALVSIWSAHLDPADGVMWDISPASIGAVHYLPRTFEGHLDFYKFIEGGDASFGHGINPHTGQPYPPQIVPRADYARVLAEFWADGPDSETPPGHWYTILNYVNDHPLFEKRFRGVGPELDELEWDVKAYFLMGGTVHDAAVSAWSIKGWYDYIRPISALRSMAARGQSSDPSLANYSPQGLPLVPGYIEVVDADDPLAGVVGQHVGKIKLYAWKGPDFIQDPESDVAGVDWILAENWWPYQRPSFVTPPFAGYVSGHSTFSRAAAEMMTLLTGDEFFPGGVGEFIAPKNEFLVFEDGPSQDIVLQWATYRDASDQTSLSRIWGGIHPPADDIPGRIIGERIGLKAFDKGEQYFLGQLAASIEGEVPQGDFEIDVYPNPIRVGNPLRIEGAPVGTRLVDILGRTVGRLEGVMLDTSTLAPGLYFIRAGNTTKSVLLVR